MRAASGTARRRRRHPSHRRSRTSRRRLGSERSTTHPAQAEAFGVLLTAARADDHVEETTAWTASASAAATHAACRPHGRPKPGKKFTEPVALLSTRPTDRPLPRRAFRLSFDLLALRARCVEEPRAWSPIGSSPLPIELAQFASFFAGRTRDRGGARISCTAWSTGAGGRRPIRLRVSPGATRSLGSFVCARARPGQRRRWRRARRP